jgi:hypothetical protein
MNQNNYQAAPSLAQRLLSGGTCPKCGAEMEPIDSGPEGPAVEHLQLCPGCYLVMWTDDGGLQVRQGVPVNKEESPISEPAWFTEAPTKC